MFPDSDIGRSYSMAKTKLSYVINFSIATHFKRLVLEEISQNSTQYILMKVWMKLFQSAKLTLISGSGKKVQMRLLISIFFLGHASAQNLLEEFQQALKYLRESNASMDGDDDHFFLMQEITRLWSNHDKLG